jgi:hypothetical protein
MGNIWKAGRKGVARGRRRSERAPQANEPKRSAQLATARTLSANFNINSTFTDNNFISYYIIYFIHEVFLYCVLHISNI